MIKKFIEDNNIEFNEGERNSSLVILIGFSLFKKLTKEDLEEALSDEIEEDYEIQMEIDRLWNYCKSNKYGNWWKNKSAKSQYTF